MVAIGMVSCQENTFLFDGGYSHLWGNVKWVDRKIPVSGLLCSLSFWLYFWYYSWRTLFRVQWQVNMRVRKGPWEKSLEGAAGLPSTVEFERPLKNLQLLSVLWFYCQFPAQTRTKYNYYLFHHFLGSKTVTLWVSRNVQKGVIRLQVLLLEANNRREQQKGKTLPDGLTESSHNAIVCTY